MLTYVAESRPRNWTGRAVTRFLAMDTVLVDKPHFRHMVSKLNPHYQLPSRKHLSENLSFIYSHIRDSTCICLHWKRPDILQQPLICRQVLQWRRTVHFIHKTWLLQLFWYCACICWSYWTEHSRCRPGYLWLLAGVNKQVSGYYDW